MQVFVKTNQGHKWVTVVVEELEEKIACAIFDKGTAVTRTEHWIPYGPTWPTPVITLFKLNLDVLKAIMDYVTPSDAGRLLRTCRSAYALALPRFLSEIRIGCSCFREDQDPTRLQKFCQFMLAKPLTHIPCMRSLKLSSPFGNDATFSFSPSSTPDYSALPMLTEVLLRAADLVKFEVDDLEILLQRDDHLAHALSTLPKLKIIDLGRIGRLSAMVLSRMISEPTHLSIIPHAMILDDIRSMDLFRSLPASLRKLSIACEWGLQMSSTENLTRPHIRVLELSRCRTHLTVFAQVFPSVRHLVIDTPVTLFAHSQPVSWPSLDQVSVLGFITASHPEHIIPICHPIRRLDMNGQGTRLIASLVTRLSPVVLTCTVNWLDLETVSCFAAAVNLKLQYVDVTFTAREADQLAECEAKSWMSDYIQALSAHPLIGLVIRQGDIHLCEESLLELALEAVENIGSLQYVGICRNWSGREYGASEHRSGIPLWQRVVSRDGDSPSLQVLSEGQGREVELHLLETSRPQS